MVTECPDPTPEFTGEQLDAWLAEAFDDRPDTEQTEQRGRTSKELARRWHLSNDMALERIHYMVGEGKMKCAYERRMTITGYAATRPVYVELGERKV